MHRFAAAVGIMTILVMTVSLRTYTQSTRTANTASRAFYNVEQAQRGKALYSRNCSKCHLDNLQGNCPAENVRPGSPYVCAPRGSAPPLAGGAFLQRWYSVGDLYARVRWSMPADNVGGLSANDNRAIVAYLLQVNDLPAGTELRDDVSGMKRMVLQEKTRTPSSIGREPLNGLGISEAYY